MFGICDKTASLGPVSHVIFGGGVPDARHFISAWIVLINCISFGSSMNSMLPYRLPIKIIVIQINISLLGNQFIGFDSLRLDESSNLTFTFSFLLFERAACYTHTHAHK